MLKTLLAFIVLSAPILSYAGTDYRVDNYTDKNITLTFYDLSGKQVAQHSCKSSKINPQGCDLGVDFVDHFSKADAMYNGPHGEEHDILDKETFKLDGGNVAVCLISSYDGTFLCN